MYSSKAIITGLITIMFISQSCSSLERVSNPYYLANRNITAINRQLKKYKERGNVFCFSSTASSDVIVWHYSPESVEYVLYRKGRIIDIQQYKSNGLSAIKTFANSWEIPNYSYVLDGDMLYMCIDDFSIEESLLVDILDKTSLPHNKLVLFIVSDLLQYYSLIHELQTNYPQSYHNCLLLSGCIPTKEISIKNKEINPDGLYHSMTEYIISNNTDTNYYTWVDYNSYYSKDSIEVNLSHYLFIFHGDYNLGALLTDNVFFNDGFYPEIGVSFLKEIGPGESFTYLVTGDKKDRDSFKNHIFLIDESRFLTVVGSVINTEVLYKANEIKVNAPLQEIR